MVNLIFFKLNACGSHATTRSFHKLKNIAIQTVLSRKQQLGLIEKWWN